MSAAEEPRRRGLGRGLSALLGDAPSAVVEIYQPTGRSAELLAENAKSSERSVRNLPVEKLHPGKFQPRRVFDQQAIDDLAESVREKGILMPILVRRHPDHVGEFEIIAGERRWRAAQAASLHEVPAIVRELTDQEALEIGLIENLQRQDLSPLEEAEGYRRLMDDFSHTQEQLAKTVGKSRSHVANTMRLLALPDSVKEMLDKSELTAGHARALLTSPDPVALARQVVLKGLSVRQVEALAQKPESKAKQPKTAKSSVPAGTMVAASGVVSSKDADLLLLERDLSNLLGLKVTICTAGEGGTLSVEYSSLEQLDDLLARLHNGPADESAEMEIPTDELLKSMGFNFDEPEPDTEFGDELAG